MAKKTAGRRGRSRGNPRHKKFSVKALHRQLDAVLKRLGKSKTKSAIALRTRVRKLRSDTFCPRNMSFDLTE